MQNVFSAIIASLQKKFVICFMGCQDLARQQLLMKSASLLQWGWFSKTIEIRSKIFFWNPISQMGLFVPAEYFEHGIIWEIENFSNLRLMSQSDQVSQFGSELSSMNRILNKKRSNSMRPSLYIIDNWGQGTLIGRINPLNGCHKLWVIIYDSSNNLDDKRIILASALTYLSNLTNTITFITTRDAVLTGYILENLNRIDMEKSSIKTRIISSEGQTPFAPRTLRSYRLEFQWCWWHGISDNFVSAMLKTKWKESTCQKVFVKWDRHQNWQNALQW